MSFSRVAIIGAGGFIGKNLAKKLNAFPLERLDLYGRNSGILNPDLPPVNALNLHAPETWDSHYRNAELLYYLASETIPASSWNNPIAEIEKNLIPFLKFVEFAAERGLKKIVYISSAGTVYGSSDQPLNENSLPRPFSPYGITKVNIEHFLSYFERRLNLKSDIFRVSNVYGFGQNISKGLGIINIFLEQILTNGQVRVFGNGSAVRNYVFIDDVSQILARSVHSGTDESRLFNLASNEHSSVNELLNIIRNITNMEFEVQYAESRDSDNTCIKLCNQKLLAAYPDFQFTSLPEGIASTFKMLKNNLVGKN